MRLVAAARGDARIIVRDDLLEARHLRALQACCDACVSLHRCEGFGLLTAEAMLMGKPVIATGYSGNMEYMTPANSCLVDYRLVPVGAGDYPHAQGQRWAEPDIADAARHMRALYGDRALGHRLGDRAAADMHARYSPAASLHALQARLRQVADTSAAAAARQRLGA
jgi:glycosyltransferase involved in cell wall biosynthesis